jgi:hypothetical protein
MSKWEAQLAEQKEAYQEQQNLAGSFRQYDKQEELKFWQDKLALTTTGSQDNLAVRKNIANLQLQLNKDAFDQELQGLKTQEAAYKNNLQAKLAISQQEAELIGQRYGTESKEYKAAQQQIVDIRRQAAEQIRQIAEIQAQTERDARLADVESQQQIAELDLQMGVINQQQMLQLDQQFEDRRYQIHLQALQERQAALEADPDRNPVALAQLHAQIEQLERQHQQRMGQIRDQLTVEQNKTALQAFSSIQSSWSNLISQMMQGNLTLSKFVSGLFKGIVQAIADSFAQLVSEWLIQQAKMLIFGKTTGLSQISANAGIAGSAAVASTAAIPIIGPELAPAAGAAAFAQAMGFAASLASAAGGYDIPGTVNPLVQAHAKEMILPAKHADVIRGLADEGGRPANRGGEVHYHDYSGTLSNDQIYKKASVIADALNKAHRNGWRPKT